MNLLDRMRRIVVLRRLLGGRRFSTDIVQEVFAALGEEFMLEFPGVVAMVGRGRIVAISDFVEVVFVQLSDKRGKVAVLEVLGQDLVGKLVRLLSERRVSSSLKPWLVVDFREEKRTSTTTKVSPLAVHFTMSLYSGSSSILHDSAISINWG